MLDHLKIVRTEQSRLPGIDFASLRFGTVFADHMLTLDYADGSWSLHVATASTVRLTHSRLVSGEFPSELSFIQSLKREPRRYFYERHIRIAIVMNLIVFLAPLVGVVVNDAL